MSQRLLSMLLLTAATFTQGCWVKKMDINAPGHSVIEEEPKKIETEGCEMAEQPGQYFAGASTGIYSALGSSNISGTSITNLQSQLGLETSLGFGWSDYSEGLPVPTGIWPIRKDFALALNLGWTFWQRTPAMGQVYAELQYGMFFTGLAFGWVMEYDKHEFAHHQGPQGTIFLGPLYVRVSHFVDLRTDILFGLMLKLPALFVWNR